MKNEIIALLTNTSIVKFLLAVFVFYCLDFLTGFSRAWRDKNIQSAKLRNSVVKAIQYIAFLTIGIVADIVFSLNKCTIACALVLCSIELTSIIENLESLELPKFIINLFKGGDK